MLPLHILRVSKAGKKRFFNQAIEKVDELKEYVIYYSMKTCNG